MGGSYRYDYIASINIYRRIYFLVAEERPKSTSLHRKPSSAWRRERRRDPIQSEALDMSAARVHHHNRPSVIVPAAPQPGMSYKIIVDDDNNNNKQ